MTKAHEGCRQVLEETITYCKEVDYLYTVNCTYKIDDNDYLVVVSNKPYRVNKDTVDDYMLPVCCKWYARAIVLGYLAEESYNEEREIMTIID